MTRPIAARLATLLIALFLTACPDPATDPTTDAAPDAALDATPDTAPPPDATPDQDSPDHAPPDQDPPDAACRPAPERCNDRDDDCDGTTDEDYPTLGAPCTEGQGICTTQGTLACAPDGRALICTAPDTQPAPETCNDLDDDCDGEIDEDFGVGLPCEEGIGACHAMGQILCADNRATCSAIATEPTAETCDATDEDCDGRTDERLTGLACATGLPGACNVGLLVCAPGTPNRCDPAVQPVAEICDGIDNDCDAATDEEGICTETCDNAIDDDLDDAIDCADPDCDLHIACRPPQETCNNAIDDDADTLTDCDDPDCAADAFCQIPPEDCTNTQDDDRDGLTDCDDPDCADDAICQIPPEDCANTADDDRDGLTDCDDPDCADDAICQIPPELCANNQDDDADGRTDCQDADCQDRPACGRTVLVCGEPQRDLTALFAPADDIALASGCDPDPTVRAILAAREAPILAERWRPWIEAGGRIITEYSNSDEVFTALLGEPAAPGEQIGGCRDNVNPVVRFNEDDAFWRINGRHAPDIFDRSGCGFDLARYPGLVPLGGWTADTVSLAYRDLGEGRIWLVEGDWQDSEADEGSFSLETQSLLRSMALDPFTARCDPAGACPGTLRCIDRACVRLLGPVREVLMRCGRSDRDIATFVPPGFDLEIIEGCEPDERVQALLVTRHAIDDAQQLDGRLLGQYLEGGGIIITEYSASDEIYNIALNAAAEPGNSMGACEDNINPPVRHTLDDPFWLARRDLPPLGDAPSGCGYDLSRYPGITRLGGWDDISVSLAYIDHGDGRLWLVESDWQDNDVGFTAESLALMHAMILDRGRPNPRAPR